MRDFLNGIFDRLFMYLPDCIQQTPPSLPRHLLLGEEPIYLSLKRL